MTETTHETPTEYITVEIYDQLYHLSGQNAEHIRALAARVDAKMRAVAAQVRTVDSPYAETVGYPRGSGSRPCQGVR